VKLVLKEPIEFGEKGPPITELNFRERIVAGDLRGIRVSELGDPPLEKLLTVAGRLSGQPEGVMSKLGLLDLDEVVNAVDGFIRACRKTGTTPSR
jgi:hypothetical protein